MEWLESVITLLMKMIIMIMKNKMGRHYEMYGKGSKNLEGLDMTEQG